MILDAHNSSPWKGPVPPSGCNLPLSPWDSCCCAPVVPLRAARLGPLARVSRCFEVGEGTGGDRGHLSSAKKGSATRSLILYVSSFMRNGGFTILLVLADWWSVRSKKAKPSRSGKSQSVGHCEMVDSPSLRRDWKFFPWQDGFIHPAANWGSWFMSFRSSNASGPFQIWDLYLLLWLSDLSVKLRQAENLTWPRFLSRMQVSLTRGAGQIQKTLNLGRERSVAELRFLTLWIRLSARAISLPRL